MAIKATIYKAQLQIADMDRQVYADTLLTLALQPSETEERLMLRLLAYALNVTADDRQGTLQVARGLTDTEEPDLWHRDLTEQVQHWIEVGQPADERRLTKACGRATRVTLYAYSASAHIWWQGMANKVTRLRNLNVWRIPAEQSQALAKMAQRSMQLQWTIQDGHVWVSDASQSVEVVPEALWRGGN